MTRSEEAIYRRERKVPGTKILRYGWPDFLVMRNGKVWGIEVKQKPDKVRRDQHEMHKMLLKAGIETIVEWVETEPGIDSKSEAKRQLRAEIQEVWEKLNRKRIEMEQLQKTVNKLLRRNATNDYL